MCFKACSMTYWEIQVVLVPFEGRGRPALGAASVLVGLACIDLANLIRTFALRESEGPLGVYSSEPPLGIAEGGSASRSGEVERAMCKVPRVLPCQANYGVQRKEPSCSAQILQSPAAGLPSSVLVFVTCGKKLVSLDSACE